MSACIFCDVSIDGGGFCCPNCGIDQFIGKYAFLSNFYPCNLPSGYPTVEHAYQAMKTTDLSLRSTIKACAMPGQAKRMGSKIPLRPDWDSVKEKAMKFFLGQKFSLSSNLDLSDSLLKTNDLVLIEGNWWGDEYWGMSFKTGKGQNRLGILLMEIRDELSRRDD